MESLEFEVRDLSECCYTYNFGKIKITGFDDELLSKAEESTAKWMPLFRCSNNENIDTIPTIYNSTRFDANSFSQQTLKLASASKQDVINEKKNFILLNKKYFGFETSNTQSIPSNSEEQVSDLAKYSTVFDYSDSDGGETGEKSLQVDEVVDISENISTNERKPTADKSKNKNKNKNKKKKGRNQYRPLENSELFANPAQEILGGPPGVTIVTNSRHPRHFDLSKNANCSLQFRL